MEQEKEKNEEIGSSNYLEYWKEKVSTENELKQAKDRFRVKTYQERFRWAKITALVTSYILPVVSVASGLFAVATAIQSLIPWWFIAFPIAFLLLSIWEIGKNRSIDTAVELGYIKPVKALWLLPVCLFFAILSGFASVNGAEQAHEALNTKAQNIKESYESSIDSVGLHYDGLVTKEEEKLETYMNRVMYNGKINIHNEANKATQEASSKEVTRLNEERKKVIEELKKEQEELVHKATDSFDKNRTIVLFIIILIELLIIGSNWYLVHYDSCISKEEALIMANMGNGKVSIGDEDLKGVFWYLVNGMQNTGITASQQHQIPSGANNQIGFQFYPNGAINTPINTPIQPTVANKAQQEAIGLLKKYPEIVEVLKQGGTLRQGVEVSGVSRSTVQNVKRALRLIEAYGVSI